MLALPPMPPATGFGARVRLPRDYYVRVAGNDYSVDPVVIGRMVQVHADLDTVTVTCEGRAVAAHRRCWATAQTITDPEHVATARRLRQAILAPPVVGADALLRDLADYDAAFGVDLDTRAEADGQVA